MPRKKLPLPKPADLSADSGRFIDDLQRETDRGIGLVGAAFLDDAVRALIRAALIRESETADRLFEYPRPLHSFAARMDVAYCMGLIGKVTYQDLGLVREIRNRFAHQHHPATFEDPELSQMCERFQTARMIIDSSKSLRLDARGRFIVGVVILAHNIVSRGVNVEHAEPGRDFSVGPAVRTRTDPVEVAACGSAYSKARRSTVTVPGASRRKRAK